MGRFYRPGRKSAKEKQGFSLQKEDLSDLQNLSAPIPRKISECETLIREIFNNSADIIVEPFETQQKKAMIVYIDGLVNRDLLDRDIITPLKAADFDGNLSLAIKTHFTVAEKLSTLLLGVVKGDTAVFYDDSPEAFIVDLKQWDKRSVETPDVEAVVRGPREGFTESILSNTAMLRRKVRTPKLIFEGITLGRQTNTSISLAYVDGIVNQDVLQKVRERLEKIDTEAILESGHIEQFIGESSLAPISGIGVTQKPDVVASKILEGRVALFCDGTPHVLTIPELFIENLQTSEDYYSPPVLASITRIFRLMGLLITIMLPGLSVAVITYNQEMMPSVFLKGLIASTQKTPLPAGAEIFFLVIMFALLQEAGIRLPKAVGSAMTIVGALIIGEAAVNAGVVGAPAVIIVALTAVSSFLVSSMPEFCTVYRYLFLFLGGTLGLIGIGTGIVIMLTHLGSTVSFGIPVLASFSGEEMKDSVIRAPFRYMNLRPTSIARGNIRREDGHGHGN